MCPGSAALILLFGLASNAAAQIEGVNLALYRTRGGAELTLIEGVVEIDYRVVHGGAECGYVISLEVADAAGLRVLRDGWEGRLICETTAMGSETGRELRAVDTFRFAVMPGRYSLHLSVGPADRPEAAHQVDLEFVSLASNARASDLFLARDIGLVQSGEEGRWIMRKGDIGIAAAPNLTTYSSRPNVSYYLEVYPRPGEVLDGMVVGVVRSVDGDELARVRLDELESVAESRPVAGMVPLTGLPPGDYELEVELQLGDDVVRRSRGFRMAELGIPAPEGGLQIARREAGAADLGYFGQLSDEELTQLFDPILVWLAGERERELYQALPPDGKRRFLAQYFENAESSLDLGGAAPLEVYLERIRHVTEAYGERVGHGAQQGWRTDRGRIYLLRGKPDERVDRPFPADNSEPYEIWYYRIGRGYVYLFVDETRFGNYRLLFSTDPNVARLPGWQGRVGPSALEDMYRLFGVRAGSSP